MSVEKGQKEKEKEKGRNLEEYAHALEMQLTMKSALLSEALRLHQTLEARLVALEQGVAYKECQLDALKKQHDESTRKGTFWRSRVELLEENNVDFRDRILELGCEAQNLRSPVFRWASAGQASSELTWRGADCERQQTPSASIADFEKGEDEAAVQRLSEQLLDSNQKNLLLEEQLRIRSGSGPGTFGAPDANALPELGALANPADAWAAVGWSAADQLCGTSPHGHAVRFGLGFEVASAVKAAPAADLSPDGPSFCHGYSEPPLMTPRSDGASCRGGGGGLSGESRTATPAATATPRTVTGLTPGATPWMTPRRQVGEASDGLASTTGHLEGSSSQFDSLTSGGTIGGGPPCSQVSATRRSSLSSTPAGHTPRSLGPQASKAASAPSGPPSACLATVVQDRGGSQSGGSFASSSGAVGGLSRSRGPSFGSGGHPPPPPGGGGGSHSGPVPAQGVLQLPPGALPGGTLQASAASLGHTPPPWSQAQQAVPQRATSTSVIPKVPSGVPGVAQALPVAASHVVPGPSRAASVVQVPLQASVALGMSRSPARKG